MDIILQGINESLIKSRFMFRNNRLKSTENKLERQEKCKSQVAFLEKQKENLKNMKCDSVEDIAEKLNMLHSYEDRITVVKTAYNDEQMQHMMDEAKEKGERMAEKAEEQRPRTPEERKEDSVEKALGMDENENGLEEKAEEITELEEELKDKLLKEVLKELVMKSQTERTEQVQDLEKEKLVKQEIAFYDAVMGYDWESSDRTWNVRI